MIDAQFVQDFLLCSGRRMRRAPLRDPVAGGRLRLAGTCRAVLAPPARRANPSSTRRVGDDHQAHVLGEQAMELERECAAPGQAEEVRPQRRRRPE